MVKYKRVRWHANNKFKCVYYDIKSGHCLLSKVTSDKFIHSVGCYGKCNDFKQK